MRRLTAAILCLLALAAAPAAQAEDRPVVVELYTSQGCSSCPPADALLKTLAERDDVIALAMHVDYWDYIGWKDIFADPAYTARQKAYAYANGTRTVYTPQMIVGGRDHVVGYKPMKLAGLIGDHADRPQPVTVRLVRAGARLTIEATPPARPRSMVVQLIRYIPGAEVEIARGENAGRTLHYANIVSHLEVLAKWGGMEPLSLTAEVPGEAPVVVLVQEAEHGPILGAARLR